MPLARSTMLETDLAALWIESELLPRSIPYRQCLPDIILPTGEVAELDLLTCVAKPDGEVYEAMEFKRFLDDELVEQCLRWLNPTASSDGDTCYWWPLANRVRCGFLHGPMNRPGHVRRFSTLQRMGIWISTWNEVAQKWHHHHDMARYFADADTSILADAFARGDATLDPGAGSAGAKRQTAARAAFHDETLYLREHGPQSNSDLNRALKKDTTAHARRKAIKNLTWLGVSYTDDLPTMFYAEEKA